MAFGSRSAVAVDVVEQFIDNTDFAILVDEVPPASWWRRFPFHSRGVELRCDPSTLKGWSEAAPFLQKIKYFSVRSSRTVDLSFLPNMTSLQLLSAPASSTTVDVSGLPIRWFEGQGVGLKGIFSLPTLRTLHLEKKMPEQAITSHVEELVLRAFRCDLDLSMCAHPESIRRVFIDRAKSVDLTSLVSLTSLEDLSLWECATVDGVGQLTQLRSLKRLMILDCPVLHGVSILRQLDGVQASVGGANAFSPPLREALSASGRSRWEFPDIAATGSGALTWLEHPGLLEPLEILSHGDFDGPGEALSDDWESKSDIEQRSLMIVFADRLAFWLTGQGVDHVFEAATRETQPYRGEIIRHLLDSRESIDLSFMAGDILVARIVESIWVGVVVKAERAPNLLLQDP